jgi:hypothetical protein
MYTFRSDGAGCLCVLEEMLRFVQECAKRWDDITWKQAANVKYTATDSKHRQKLKVPITWVTMSEMMGGM